MLFIYEKKKFILKKSIFWIFFIGSLFSLLSCTSFQSIFFSKNMQTRKIHIEKLWVRSTLEDVYLGTRLNHYMSPILIDHWIIQGNSIDGLGAYERKTGKKIWKIELKGGVESGIYKDKDHIFFGARDGFFYCVRLKDTRIRWKFQLQSEGLGTPTVDEGVVYFMTGSDLVYALNAKTGKKVWSYKHNSSSSFFSVRGVNRPMIYKENIYIGFKNGDFVALDKKTGRFNWSTKLSSNKPLKDVDAEPVIEGSRIYVSSYNSSLYSLDIKTGRKIWTVNHGGHTGVTLSKNIIYYSTSDKKILALEKGSGKTIWTYTLEKGVATQPLLYRGLLIFGESKGSLQVIDSSTGRFLTKFNPGMGLMARPQIDLNTGELYFISNDANLFALRLFWKSLRRLELEDI